MCRRRGHGGVVRDIDSGAASGEWAAVAVTGIIDVVLLIVAAILLVWLFVALLFPERFDG